MTPWCRAVAAGLGWCPAVRGADDGSGVLVNRGACCAHRRASYPPGRVPVPAPVLVYRVQGCTETNTGFDGVSYTPVWPDGNTRLHPTPFQFSSALTGTGFDQPYPRVAFEADLPAVESTCSRATGNGCTLIPQTDPAVQRSSTLSSPTRTFGERATGSSATTPRGILAISDATISTGRFSH